jgi:hypothetical protein
MATLSERPRDANRAAWDGQAPRLEIDFHSAPYESPSA